MFNALTRKTSREQTVYTTPDFVVFEIVGKTGRPIVLVRDRFTTARPVEFAGTGARDLARAYANNCQFLRQQRARG